MCSTKGASAWFVPVFAGLCIACGPVIELEPAAERVQLFAGASSHLLDGYEPLGTIECNKGGNTRALDTNIRQCQNDLRNRTAAMQGDVVVITSQALGPGDCDNCVVMFATAYRRLP